MHVHLPKPLHGWRAFVGEVGIIVLGVLIALSAEQVVDDLRWRREVNGARLSLNAQLADSKSNALERLKIKRCLAEQLDKTRQLISGTAPRPIYVWGAPDRFWILSAWDSAVASGAMQHMSRSERDLYANLNTYNLKLSQWNAQELDLEGELRSLRHPRVLSAPERDRLLDDVSRLESLNFIITESAEQWLDLAKPLHLSVGPDEEAYLRRSLPCPSPDEPPRKV